jgi:hypothetical protein
MAQAAGDEQRQDLQLGLSVSGRWVAQKAVV